MDMPQCTKIFYKHFHMLKMITCNLLYKSHLFHIKWKIYFSVSGVPIVYILLYVPDLMPWEVNPFLSWCHIAGSVSPWIGSFLYHLFMNINYSKVAYWRLLQLDMLGIWISQSFGKHLSYYIQDTVLICTSIAPHAVSSCSFATDNFVILYM